MILYQEYNIFLYQLFIYSPDRNTWCNNFKLKKHKTCGNSEWDFTFYSECHLFMPLTMWVGEWSLVWVLKPCQYIENKIQELMLRNKLHSTVKVSLPGMATDNWDVYYSSVQNDFFLEFCTRWILNWPDYTGKSSVRSEVDTLVSWVIDLENCLKGIKEGEEKRTKSTIKIEYLSQTVPVGEKNSMIHGCYRKRESNLSVKISYTWHVFWHKICNNNIFCLI